MINYKESQQYFFTRSNDESNDFGLVFPTQGDLLSYTPIIGAYESKKQKKNPSSSTQVSVK